LTLQEFKRSLANASPPASSPLLQALWHDAKGDWQQAHEVAQEIHDADGSWVHAYLHRKEGDLGNAGYWYHRASRKMPQHSLESEWEEIVKELILKAR
jgi:hypothetical protein